MHNTFDVAVIGCGPAGATAGAAAVASGLRVAMLEKNNRFGVKLCAGGVPYEIFQDFDLLEYPVERHISRIDIFDAVSNEWTVRHQPWGNTIKRQHFDIALVEIAKQRGAHVYSGCACLALSRSSRSRDMWELKLSASPFDVAAKIIILADGANSRAPKLIPGLNPLNATELYVASQVELKAKEVESDDMTSLKVIIDNNLSVSEYAWCFPKKYGFTIGVGCLLVHAGNHLTSRSLLRLVKDHPALRSITSSATRIGPVRSWIIPARPQSCISADGILVVGDAAGQVDPLWGEGIGYAMRAGRMAGQIAAEAINQGNVGHEFLRAYEDKWNRSYGQNLLARRKVLEEALVSIQDQAHKPRA